MEFILLQPLQPENPDQRSNVSLIERKTNLTEEEESLIIHEAGGPYAGFIIKKILPFNVALEKSHLSFKLKVYMRQSGQSEMQHEQRTLQFWFSTQSKKDRMTCSNSFFHNLFKGDNFPKDYFMFVLKVMQIFKALKPISLLKIDIEKIGAPQPLNSPMSLKDPKQYAAIITGKILEFLERAFPNTISVDELARLTETEVNTVYDFLRDLLGRNLVKNYDNGNIWIRNIVNTQDEQTHEVIMVQQQPSVSNDDQPTVAIICVNYYEKLAVDAMMLNKVTFVRHKPEGESNVYTIGDIGEHRVVSTKLPHLGRDSRSAKISSGNTTTRLLGIFQRVDHVILVGCGGAVPHYSDHTRHPRRGDIIVSFPESSSPDDETQDFVYAHFDLQKTQNGSQITNKTWMPESNDLYRIVNNIRKKYNPQWNQKYPWERYLEEGIDSLYSDELDCRRPKEDKLFFTIEDKNLIEANHPEPEDPLNTDRRQYGMPMLRFGKVGGGENIVNDENLRHLLSEQYGIVIFDSDVDQVMESIEGNRKESFMIIRSVVDYQDGSSNKEWQPYSALCAAAFMKTIICALPNMQRTPH